MADNPLFSRVLIAGAGLMGGSLGMALRERRLAGRVVALVRSEASAREALQFGAADEATLDPRRAAAGAEFVVLGAPVLAMPPLLERLAPALEAGTLVTDLGSTKAELARLLPPLLPEGVEFLPGHPMAGSEKSGARYGSADLYDGAAWILCPGPHHRPESLARLEALVRGVGATPLRLEPERHDELVARVSHLPHLVSAALALAAVAGEEQVDLLRQLAAGGYASTSRLGGGAAEMWRDIHLTNREAVLAALDRYLAALEELRARVESGDADGLLAAFTEAVEARARIAG